MAILTISRQFGTGAEEIGQAIADTMGYEYIDRKRILEDMKQVGIQWEEKAKVFDEHYPNVWERYDWSYRGFVALTQSHILNHALKDNVVIIGRGGNSLLKGIMHHLGIRIEEPMEARVERVIEREGVNSENARWLIEKADREMAGSVYLIYGRRWDDPAEYDLFFDARLRSFEEIIRATKEALLAKDKCKTPRARNMLALRARAAAVKAAIATDPSFSIFILDVVPKEEGLLEYGFVLRAVVHNQEDKERLKEVGQKLAGDLPIECEIRYQWRSRFSPPRHHS